MRGENYFRRFILLVTIFVFRIGVLILSPNFIRILLGWDGLGVTSYLLVVYYQRDKSFNAGIITALTNRLGDVGLLILIGRLLQQGSWSFIYYGGCGGWLTAGLLALLVVAASTKRAQIPFSSWLPAAIAAPTPVSALVHSSTLVTAGVYLLVRINHIIAASGALWAICLLGALTILMAGISAIGELDMKKIIALSTLRQLGLMFITLGLGLPVMAFFHLISHAYFKAILFICAGGIIHRINDYQDLRAMGAALKRLPYIIRIFLVARISLCGLPFISGFYSKDLILELMIAQGANLIIFFIALIATGLTVIYSLRALSSIFIGELKIEASSAIVESEAGISLRMAFLFPPTILGGLFISWALMSNELTIFLPGWIKFSILFVITLASFVGLQGSRKRGGRAPKFKDFIWFIPFLFRVRLSKGGLILGKKFFSRGDRGWMSHGSARVFSQTVPDLSRIALLSSSRNFLKRVVFLGALLILNV